MKKRLSLDLVLLWHKEVFQETKPDIAGRIKEYPMRVGSWRAPDWQDVDSLMKEFIRWYDKNRQIMHPVELAARAHYRFEKIHPFRGWER